jgi:ribosomal-protein-alanine N-acetyltransferase
MRRKEPRSRTIGDNGRQVIAPREGRKILETERLLLREFVEEDIDDLLEVPGDPDAMRYYPHPFSREEVAGWIDWGRRSYAENGFGLWALVLKESTEVIGDCGLIVQDVEGERLVEVGYHLKRSHWHRGLATEAARASCNHAFQTLPVDFVIALVRPENQPSAAVAERVGMHVWKSVDRKGMLHFVYRVGREEFRLREVTAS